MTQLEALFRDKYPEIDTLIEHSPMRARFLLLSFLYNQKIIENTEESKVIEKKEEE